MNNWWQLEIVFRISTTRFVETVEIADEICERYGFEFAYGELVCRDRVGYHRKQGYDIGQRPDEATMARLRQELATALDLLAFGLCECSDDE